MSQQSIKVQILGRDYPLLVESSDIPTIRSVAENVNQRMTAFKKKFPEQPDLIAAVFTAMELAEELLGARETYNVLLSAIDRETHFLGRELSQALKHTSTSNE